MDKYKNCKYVSSKLKTFACLKTGLQEWRVKPLIGNKICIIPILAKDLYLIFTNNSFLVKRISSPIEKRQKIWKYISQSKMCQ